MDDKDLVEMTEIWRLVESGGDVIHGDRQLKKVAILVDGFPIFLEKDFLLERRKITREEEKNIRSLTPL